MIALLLAAQVAAAPPLIQPKVFYGGRPEAFCKANGKLQTSDPALLYRRDGKPLGHKLADLPKPNEEKAVLRAIDGCAAPLVVQFNVGP
jgi:hypothetical protein